MWLERKCQVFVWVLVGLDIRERFFLYFVSLYVCRGIIDANRRSGYQT